MKRTLITSALPYANGYIHLGHCAGAYLPADIYARHLRLRGEEVLYVCGSDEHGVAITISAEKESKAPKSIIDKYHQANMEAFQKFGMSFDIYSRTSLNIHHETALEFFEDLLKKGYLVEKDEEQFYDERACMFLPDRYVEGICPNCGYDKARGDQCDSCGAYYNQLELKNPLSLVSGKPPVVKQTTHWYLMLGKFQEFLEKYVESHSGDWKENVLNQTKSWLRQGLTDRAITRDLNWGVKIDKVFNLPKEKTKGKVLYVWFEAVLGYISATKQWAAEKKASTYVAKDEWKKWWCDRDTRYIAFIGKDNIVFHTLIFPTILHAKGGYILPDNVPANEFLNLEGQKFSKSRNWSIDLKDFVSDFSESYYIDGLRYTLAMNLPETKDSDFTWKDFQARNNNELAAIFGNFVNRTLQFVNKSFGGRVPFISGKYHKLPQNWVKIISYLNTIKNDDIPNITDSISDEYKGLLPENEFNLIIALWLGISRSNRLYERFRFRDAITETMNIVRAANKYFNDEAPWKTVESDNETCSKSIYFCVQIVRSLSVLFAPVTPFACRRINRMLNIEPVIGNEAHGIRQDNLWDKASLPMIDEGSKINQPGILFTRIEDSQTQKQIEKLKKALAVADETKAKEAPISIDDFAKLVLKTAKVLEAERVPNSNKLIRLVVDLGTEKKQIVAGIAEHFSTGELIGKMVVVVANLHPTKLMGIESQGMVLAAGNEKGNLTLLTVMDESVGSGSKIK